MKRTILFITLVLMLIPGAFAHDKGDLMLNIEPQFGVAIPPLEFMNHLMMPGIDYSLRAIVDYYFTDFFAINLGLGYSGNYHLFFGSDYFISDTSGVGVEGLIYFVPLVGQLVMLGQLIGAAIGGMVDNDGTFFASYITIPLGFRLSLKAFTFGVGATANIPLHPQAIGKFYYESKEYRKSDGKEGFAGDVTFDLYPHFGWYADIGFDLSGRKEKKHGFGILWRLSGTFTEEIAEPSAKEFKKDGFDQTSLDRAFDINRSYNFRFFSSSLILKFSFEMANLPI